MEVEREARLSPIVSVIISVISFVTLLPILLSIVAYLTAVTWLGLNTAAGVASFDLSKIILAVTLVSDCLLTRMIYVRLRWRRSAQRAEFTRLLTARDWAMAVLNFVVMLFVLFLVVSLILMLAPSGIGIPSRGGLLLIVLVPHLLSAASSYLYLRSRVRKRLEEREREIGAGLVCRCGYDLTGNVSGVCPECGEPTRH